MGRPSINSIYTQSVSRLKVVEKYIIKAKLLPPDLYGFVAEIMLLRIFSIIEFAVRETAARIACEVPYRDGVAPTNIILKCSSIPDALNKFKTHNRKKPLKNLHFTNVSNTNDAIEFVIDTNESFRLKLNAYGVIFEELRKLRNHIAHRNSNTRKGFNNVITQKYGGYVKLKPSNFLISTKWQVVAPIEEYLKIAKIMVNEITTS